MNPTPIFHLSEESQSQLNSIIADPTSPEIDVKRAKALLLIDAGTPYKEVAKKVGFKNAKSIRNLIRRFENCGIDCLSDASRERKNEKGTPKTIDRLTGFLNENPSNNGSKWKLEELVVKLNASRTAIYDAVKILISQDNNYSSRISYKDTTANRDNCDSVENNDVETNSVAFTVAVDDEVGVTQLVFNLSSIVSGIGCTVPTTVDELQETITTIENQFSIIARSTFNSIVETCFNNRYPNLSKDECRVVQCETMYGLIKVSVPKSVTQGLPARKRLWTDGLTYCVLITTQAASFRDSAEILNATTGRSGNQALSPTTICYKKTEWGKIFDANLIGCAKTAIGDLKFNENGLVEDCYPYVSAESSAIEYSSLTSSYHLSDLIEDYNFGKQHDMQLESSPHFIKTFEKDPEKTVYATGDGCYVPAQKNKRDVNGKKGSKETEYVPNAVSTVQFGLRTKHDEEQDASVKDMAYIAGATYYEVFYILFGIVISLGLLSNQVVFFFDGELRIVEFFLKFFWWKGNDLIIIMDWYHLDLIAGQYLSIILKNDAKYKEDKNKIKKTVAELLWLGKVQECISLLKKIDKNLIKDEKKLQDLINYLVEREEFIVCYEMRRRIGLPNSSNPAETAANILVAKRQKKKGASWSYAGSRAMATIASLKKNNLLKNYIQGNYTLPSFSVSKTKQECCGST